MAELNTRTRKLTREQIAAIVGNNPRAIKLFEAITSDVAETIPVATLEAMDAADDAQASADAARAFFSREIASVTDKADSAGDLLLTLISKVAALEKQVRELKDELT